MIHSPCFFFISRPPDFFLIFTSNLRVKSQKTAHHHGRRAATSPPSGSGRTTSHSTSAAALASGMPLTTISDCSCVRITPVDRAHTITINSTWGEFFTVSTSLRQGLFSHLHRPPGCPKRHQYVRDAISMQAAASGRTLMCNTATKSHRRR